MGTLTCAARKCGMELVADDFLFCFIHAVFIPWTIREKLIEKRPDHEDAMLCAQGLCAIGDKLKPTDEEMRAMTVLL